MQASGNNDDQGLEGASFRELRLLEEVASTPDVSQRRLAGNVGIALGVVNVLVKSLVKKGYLRATRLTWRRWAYILTPAGAARKVQLTVNYVDHFLDHYRRVRSLVGLTLDGAELRPESKVAIYGSTELGELFFLALKDAGVRHIDFLDDSESGEFLGAPVRRLDTVDPDEYMGIMLGYSSDVDSKRQHLIDRGVPSSRISTLLDQLRSEKPVEESQAQESR